MVRTIDVKELKTRLAADPTAVVVDVRTPGEFAIAHVPQARNFPLGDTRPEHILSAHIGIRNGPVYVICQSGVRSKKMAVELDREGASQVIDVAGGTGAWVAAGFSVARTSGMGRRMTISLERQVRIVAGFLVLAGVILGFGVHPVGFGLAGLVGAGLIFAGVTDYCGMGMLLARFPWNR